MMADLLNVRGVGRFLKWRGSRVALQIPVFAISILMIAHGLFGPSLAPKNFATVFGWVHFRGLLVLILLFAGNFFCAACPFMLPRNLLRRFVEPRWAWPRWLRTKWLAVGLLIGGLFAYELFDLWSSPWWTAWIIVGYFAAALVVDGFFKNASFCKFVCPIGQFNFVGSTISPLEVTVRNLDTCATCATKDCIRGRRDPRDESVVIQRGCELALYQPTKVGNLDCTFCLDCVYACPYDNVGIKTRVPALELASDDRRSGIGRFSTRPDLAALGMAFTFGALINAFGMVSPIYAVENWLRSVFRLSSEGPALAMIFTLAVIVEPILFLGAAGIATAKLARVSLGILPLINRFAWGLVPIGVGIWLAHYGFHFFTGLLTVIPVVQRALADLGLGGATAPAWHLVGIPVAYVRPLQMMFVGLGLAGSLAVIHRIASAVAPDTVRKAFLPWALVAIILGVSAVWLLTQPMEMRGVNWGG